MNCNAVTKTLFLSRNLSTATSSKRMLHHILVRSYLFHLGPTGINFIAIFGVDDLVGVSYAPVDCNTEPLSGKFLKLVIYKI